MSTERYASVDNLTPILNKIETKLQNRYTKAEVDSAMSNKVSKSNTSGLLKNDGTVDTTSYAKQSEMSTSSSGDKTTITLKSGTSATVLNAHQDISGKVNTSAVGASNGVASLDSNGKVPSSQLPSYVDDVLEYNNKSSFPSTGESGKIYIAKDTNKTFRWSGTAYVEISESLALGETSSTAYAGDKGKANADNIGTMSNLETTEKGSLVGAINELKNSVSDGKATVATAITNQGVQTSSTASFSTMATNIGGILAANPGTMTSNVSVSSGSTDSISISATPTISANGYHSSTVGTRTAGSKTLSMSVSGGTVTVKDGSTTVGQKSVGSGSVSSDITVTSGTTSFTIVPKTTKSAGYISSGTSTGTTYTVSLSASGKTVSAWVSKPGGGILDPYATVNVADGSATPKITYNAGSSSSTFTITPGCTVNTAGYISSISDASASTIYLIASGGSVYACTKNELSGSIASQSVSTGSVTSAVSIPSGTSTSFTITPSMTFSAGYISSKGTESTKTLYLRQSGSYVYVSSSSSGGTNYGRITKTTGSATPSISITSGTTSFTITPKATVDTAGHISSISDGTASTVYLLKNGNSVYASSSSTYSSSTNYAKYDISTETKTVKASKSSSGGSDTYTPSSGKYFSSFTVKRWQSMGFIAWSLGTYGSGTGGPYYYCNEEYGNSSLYRSISNNAGCIYCNSKCAVRRESNYFYMMMATSGHTAGTIRVGLIDVNPNNLNYSDAGDAAVYYTEIAKRVSSSFGIIQLPLLATYKNNTTSNGKTWKTGTSRGTSISIGEDTPLYPFVVTNNDFAGTVMVFCGFSEM